MKKSYLIIVLSLLINPVIVNSQAVTDEFVSNCVLAAGENTTYLKDFRIQLPGAAPEADPPVYKANMYLMKNTRYRFTVCNAPGSAGELYITLHDQGRELISSYNSTTGKKYSSVDFICNKTGLYTLWYGFINGRQGSGVGVVSMIR